jgi:hypothetical protein
MYISSEEEEHALKFDPKNTRSWEVASDNQTRSMLDPMMMINFSCSAYLCSNNMLENSFKLPNQVLIIHH